MLHKENGGISWLEFELLQDLPLVHGCFSRHGGVSSGLLDSLNIGKNVGDDQKNVQINLSKISHALSIPSFIYARPCHGVDVRAIKAGETLEIPVSDGLTTSVKDYAILMNQADCQAAIFYDPICHAIANVHCGWRGSVLGIYEATVKSMKATYGSKPEDLLVCISPSLGPDHAEFINYRTELPEAFWEYRKREYYFDFWAISKWQLQKAGVLEHHIEIACVDTYSNNDYFSYRRSNKCGRQATVCALK